MQVEELKVELVHDEVNNNISLLSHNIVKKKLAWLYRMFHKSRKLSHYLEDSEH